MALISDLPLDAVAKIVALLEIADVMLAVLLINHSFWILRRAKGLQLCGPHWKGCWGHRSA